MTQINRRNFNFSILSAATLVAGCGNGIGSGNPEVIDGQVQATLEDMFQNYPDTQDLAAKSNGMLVMPLVTKGGFLLGGSFGRGALLINNAVVDYYSATSGNVGLQIGGQQFAHVLFFMTEDALAGFRRSPGWVGGADVEYATPERGKSVRAQTLTSLAPVIGVVFAQSGLRLGATLEGTKYSRIIP
jgi:lipid-binding SYLF domain-containing protein